MVRKLLQGKFFWRSVFKANKRCHRNVMRHLEFSVADRRAERAPSLEFQWIKVRSFIEVIDVFDSFEPRGYFQCYGQQEKLYTDFCKACDENAFGQHACRYHPPQTEDVEDGGIHHLPA